jgi:hypothetical protein
MKSWLTIGAVAGLLLVSACAGVATGVLVDWGWIVG